MAYINLYSYVLRHNLPQFLCVGETELLVFVFECVQAWDVCTPAVCVGV